MLSQWNRMQSHHHTEGFKSPHYCTVLYAGSVKVRSGSEGSYRITHAPYQILEAGLSEMTAGFRL
jgi:hypothetical protein